MIRQVAIALAVVLVASVLSWPIICANVISHFDALREMTSSPLQYAARFLVKHHYGNTARVVNAVQGLYESVLHAERDLMQQYCDAH